MQVIKIGMTEEVLQYIWQYQILQENSILKTVEGHQIEIIHIGNKNMNQGPDFSNSKIKIGDIEWNGNVEVHLKSSLWEKHNHQNDNNYDNVILHVVLEDDKPVKRKNGELIPCVELKSHVDERFLENYNNFIENKEIISCAKYIDKVRPITKSILLERLLVERLERKSSLFESWWLDNEKDWEQTAFEVLSYSLGLKINALQMKELADLISYKTILKHLDNPFQIESILFGVAGLIPLESSEEYTQKIADEFRFLSHKYDFRRIIKREEWKFHRLRPAAFPTIRIAQLVHFLSQNRFLFSRLKETKNIEEVRSIFKVEITDYWREHYDFDKKSKNTNKVIGNSTLDLIIINGVIPLLYLYYKKTNDALYLNRVFFFLENIKAEKNSKIESLIPFFEIKSAYDSQSVLELYDYYCSKKRCIECAICNEILC